MFAANTLFSTAAGATGELPFAGGVLLASRGGVGSDGAMRLASLFAHRRHTTVEVLAVLEPISQYLLVPEPRSFEIEEERREAVCSAIAIQCGRVVTGGGSAVVIEEGEAADCIAGRAKARGAALIAMGIGRHDPLDRLLGIEPAIAVLHRTSVPVLTAAPGATAPLRSIVIATDFSPAAERAARLGSPWPQTMPPFILSMLGPGWTWVVPVPRRGSGFMTMVSEPSLTSWSVRCRSHRTRG